MVIGLRVIQFCLYCNHSRNKQIGLLLRGRPILMITCMITDRIRIHAVLLLLLTFIMVYQFYFIEDIRIVNQ